MCKKKSKIKKTLREIKTLGWWANNYDNVIGGIFYIAIAIGGGIVAKNCIGSIIEDQKKIKTEYNELMTWEQNDKPEVYMPIEWCANPITSKLEKVLYLDLDEDPTTVEQYLKLTATDQFIENKVHPDFNPVRWPNKTTPMTSKEQKEISARYQKIIKEYKPFKNSKLTYSGSFRKH
ncbi:hypothetical protein HOK51_07075 [Candidatus Woesearchaeota archaeon]|jgi:hypothetical protein|nr:hypothetical protein [Candidatus Woesearchaeota archaeon]MBT6519583.1 hypothetical protein [Candidatus Woesearchaeota archaeon]MBT7367672.1 hypothetical protein [Candidatus Woesearchaeota archaeon]